MNASPHAWLVGFGALVSALMAATAFANPHPPRPQRDPDCTPRRAEAQGWGECRYCDRAFEGYPRELLREYGTPPPDTQGTRCDTLYGLGYRQRCLAYRPVVCRRLPPPQKPDDHPRGYISLGCGVSRSPARGWLPWAALVVAASLFRKRSAQAAGG